MKKILLDAQLNLDAINTKSPHRDSPPCPQTPQDTNRASKTDTHSIGEKSRSLRKIILREGKKSKAS